MKIEKKQKILRKNKEKQNNEAKRSKKDGAQPIKIKMLEYWMSSNKSTSNSSQFAIEEVLEDPGSAILFPGYPPWLLYFAAGCCVLFMLIGIPGNLITVAALFRTKKLRNATAVFIMNLSVSDLMFCCFNLPLATSTFWHGSWMHGALLCRLFPLLRYGLVAVSLFTVLAITINRYVMIGHPRLYPKLYKSKYLALMVLATWISGFGALVATWFEQWGRFGLDPAIGSCSILPDVNGRSPKEFLFILAFLAPCIAIIVCYARIFYIVRKTALKSRRRDKATTDLVKANLEVKYAKNFEDSAIGSSCGATLTTENGGSPTKYHHRSIKCNETTWALICADRLGQAKQTPGDPCSEDVGSLKEFENSRNSSEESRNEITSSSGRIDDSSADHASRSSTNAKEEACDDSALEDPRSNFERSVQFIPFIDGNASERDSALGDNVIVSPSSVPDLRFFEAETSSEKSESERQNSGYKDLDAEFRLQVPKRFGRPEKSANRGNNSIADKWDVLSTLPEKNRIATVTHEKNDLPRKQTDDCTSTRSDSPADANRRQSACKPSAFRRESRFRSVRNRAFESGKMSAKDKKLLKMILVIFSSFLVCYLPITITKTFKDVMDWRGLNIAGYILIYLTTCINPVIYVVMSSEYRCAYKNVLLCRTDSSASNCKKPIGNAACERRGSSGEKTNKTSIK